MLKIKFAAKHEGISNHFTLRCSINFKSLGNTGLTDQWACNDYVNKQTKFRNQPWYAIEIDLKLLK